MEEATWAQVGQSSDATTLFDWRCGTSGDKTHVRAHGWVVHVSICMVGLDRLVQHNPNLVLARANGGHRNKAHEHEKCFPKEKSSGKVNVIFEKCSNYHVKL